MKPLPFVLVCDDDVLFQFAVKEALGGHYQCVFASNGDEAIAVLRKEPIKLVLLDIQMRTPDEGLRYLPKFLEIDPDISVIISSQFQDFAKVRKAMQWGAIDYIPKSCDIEELVHALNRAVEKQNLIRRTQQHTFEVKCQQSSYPFIGISSWTRELRRVIEKVQCSNANVVITGETGTGKEIVARQLRKTLENGLLEPFVPVDSATIQSSTAESALFGHERGAFTGAERLAKGYFEEADGGVVYFDEIANMPSEIQAKLLRVLQEQEVRRLGSSRVLKLNFRTICATNKDLQNLCLAGLFKDDLFQRLNVIPIRVIPLRERFEDLPVLLEHFSTRFPSPYGKLKFMPETLEQMKAYSWPGNIRELGNTVYYLATLCDSQEIAPEDLPDTVFPKNLSKASPRTSKENHDSSGPSSDYYTSVKNYEKDLLVEKYQVHKGNIAEMAKILQMDRSHLYTKLKEFGIHSVGRRA